MNLNLRAIIPLVLLCSLGIFTHIPTFAQTSLSPAAKPELIIYNAKIKSPDAWVEAMAVKNGIIVALGSNQAVMKHSNEKSTRLDLKGATVLPGLHDSHVHPLFAGLEQFDCGFPAGASPTAIAKAVRICASNTAKGEWISGGNWVSAVFKPGEQNREFLDAVSPNNPLILNDEAHHSIWVNSLALKIAGITANTPDPEAGIIERDASGEPTGLLRESAAVLVTKLIPEPSEEARRKALILASNQMLSYGITAFTVATVRDADIVPLADLSAEGLIHQHIRGCIVWAPPAYAEINAMGERLIADRGFYARARFKPDCVKIFLDGVPTESHTAAMLAPYVDNDNSHAKEGLDRGFLLIPQDTLNQAIARFDRQGLQVKFHAAGDAAVRAALDAVTFAREKNGFGGQFHHIGHSTFVDLSDIPRARDIQLGWEFSPYIWYPNPMAATDVLAAVGSERMQRWVPIRNALDTGALVIAGSDWSVVPSVNPWLAIETMVTRQKPGGSKETLGVGQRVKLEEAFKIMTLNGARLMGHSDKVGSLETGKHADFIVTENNPFTVPVNEIHKTEVKMTFIDGIKVFDTNTPPILNAQ